MEERKRCKDGRLKDTGDVLAGPPPMRCRAGGELPALGLDSGDKWVLGVASYLEAGN